MSFEVDDLVEVRSGASRNWNPGVVVAVTRSHFLVELDTPITADAWSGVARRYGGNRGVGGVARPVRIRKHVEKLAPGELIRKAPDDPPNPGR